MEQLLYYFYIEHIEFFVILLLCTCLQKKDMRKLKVFNGGKKIIPPKLALRDLEQR